MSKIFQQTETINNGRYYVFANDSDVVKYPSVTTILGKTSDDSWLEEWRKRIGREKADAISKFSANRGTVMHLFCEHYMDENYTDKKNGLKGVLIESYKQCKNEGFTEKEIDMGRSLFFNFYNKGIFNKVKKVVLQEEALYNEVFGGYAGRVDFIYEDILGDLIVGDFKTSRKPKFESDIESYKMQLSAYFMAYKKMTNKIPRYGEIWISNEQNDVPQIIIISRLEIDKYYKMFLERVKEYHNIYSS